MQSLAFVSLAAALISLWSQKNLWVFAAFFCFSLSLALTTNLMTYAALIPTVLLGLLSFALRWDPKGLFRFVLILAIFLLSIAMFWNLLPGIFTDYGKPLTAALLGIGAVSLLHGPYDWKIFFKQSLLPILVGAFLASGLFFFLSLGTLDPSYSFSLGKKLAFSLFFSILPEELFLRGFVQKELSLLLKTDVAAQIGCILLPALLLPLVHLSWVEEPKLFLFWLGSSLIYGTLYQITRHVEAALLCRLLTLSLLLWLSQSCTAFHL